MYKIVPAERQGHPKEMIIKTAVNHRKTAYSGHFGTPGETRTHYIPLRRRTLYPGEVRGHIQKIFNFAGLWGSNGSIVRRRSLYPTELRRQIVCTAARRPAAQMIIPACQEKIKTCPLYKISMASPKLKKRYFSSTATL